MSVVIGSEDNLLEVPLEIVRDVLKAWHRGGRSDLWSIAARKNISLSPRTVMILIEEMRDRGLMGLEEQEYGPPVDGLTEAGLALAGATARKRMSRNKAQKILNKFLENCLSVNDRDDLPFSIERVWLFGSMLDHTKQDVGDIDLVVENGRPEKYQGGDSARRRFKDLGAQFNAPQRSGLMSIMGDQDFVKRKLLHGGKRHPVLSMHSTDELQEMACPCQLIFDASRSGLVDDRPLKCHPKSKSRIAQIGPKRQMPNMKMKNHDIRPLHALLFSCRFIDYKTIKNYGPWSEGSVRYRLIFNDVSCISIYCENGVQPEYEINALSKRTDLVGCDGRSRFGLLLVKTELVDNSDFRKGYKKRLVASMIVYRAICVDNECIRYSVDVAEADHLGKNLDYVYTLTFSWWLNYIVSTDIEHIQRRKAEDTDNNHSLETSVSFSSISLLAKSVESIYHEDLDEVSMAVLNR